MSAIVSGTEQITIRKCDSIDEFTACVALQKEVWNFDDRDLVPLRMFVVSQKIGGQIIGAFNGGELIGFALGLPGARGGRAYLHSHMLAVRETWRNHGLGRRLKLAGPKLLYITCVMRQNKSLRQANFRCRILTSGRVLVCAHIKGIGHC